MYPPKLPASIQVPCIISNSLHQLIIHVSFQGLCTLLSSVHAPKFHVYSEVPYILSNSFHHLITSFLVPCILSSFVHPPNLLSFSQSLCILLVSVPPPKFRAFSQTPCILSISLPPPNLRASSHSACILPSFLQPPSFRASSQAPCILLNSVLPPNLSSSCEIPCSHPVLVLEPLQLSPWEPHLLFNQSFSPYRLMDRGCFITPERGDSSQLMDIFSRPPPRLQDLHSN